MEQGATRSGRRGTHATFFQHCSPSLLPSGCGLTGSGCLPWSLIPWPQNTDSGASESMETLFRQRSPCLSCTVLGE